MNGIVDGNEILISFITVTYNCKAELEKTVESLKRQELENCEYIVIDGLSSDGTTDKVATLEVPCGYRWISEKDNGIYDAMNKGIALAKGKYILFLNAGDCLCKDAVIHMKKKLNKSSADIIYGDSISEYVYENVTIYKYKQALASITKDTLMNGMGCVHQCILAKREVLNQLHGFRTKYRTGADWDFLIRSVKTGWTLEYDSFPYCVYNRDGFSAKSHIKERHIIRMDNEMCQGKFDIGYVKDFFCIADMIKRFAGQNRYLKIERRKNLKEINKSEEIRERYIV